MNGPDQPPGALSSTLANEEMMLMLRNISSLLTSNCPTRTLAAAPQSSHEARLSRRGERPSTRVESDDDDDEGEADEDYTPIQTRAAQVSSPFGKLDLREEAIKDKYDLLKRAYTSIKLGGHCAFPKNEGAGFSKEDRLHVGHLCEIHKAVKTAMKVTISACNRHQEAYNKLNNAATAFNAFTILKNSSLTGDRRQRLIDAISITADSSRKEKSKKTSNRTGQQGHYNATRSRGCGDR